MGCLLMSCIGLVYSLILSIVNWCFDPAMDSHQGYSRGDLNELK